MAANPADPVASPPAGPVAIIGASGALGFGLALRLAATGVQIAIGSREQTRAAETAQRAADEMPGATFSAHDNAGAASAAATVILSVPFRHQSETLADIKHALTPGQLLIDATVPLAAAVGGKATRMVGVWQGSAAQQAAEMVPDGVGVVSALHTISAASLRDLDHPLGQDVLICGDSRDAKRAAGRADRAHRGAALRGLRSSGDGAHHRVADRAADLGQRPLQGARRHRADRPADDAVGVIAAPWGQRTAL